MGLGSLRRVDRTRVLNQTIPSLPSFVSERMFRYQVDTDRFFDEVDEVAKRLEFRLNYHIGAGDNDRIAKTWKAIIESWNDAEKLEKRIQDQFNKFVRAYSPGNPQTLGEGKKLRLRNRSPEQRMFDKWRRFLK